MDADIIKRALADITAGLPGFRVWPECKSVVKEVADELKTGNPLHPD